MQHTFSLKTNTHPQQWKNAYRLVPSLIMMTRPSIMLQYTQLSVHITSYRLMRCLSPGAVVDHDDVSVHNVHARRHVLLGERGTHARVSGSPCVLRPADLVNVEEPGALVGLLLDEPVVQRALRGESSGGVDGCAIVGAEIKESIARRVILGGAVEPLHEPVLPHKVGQPLRPHPPPAATGHGQRVLHQLLLPRGALRAEPELRPPRLGLLPGGGGGRGHAVGGVDAAQRTHGGGGGGEAVARGVVAVGALRDERGSACQRARLP
mmetsp:Transcript_30952/g.60467  ORF Transcript_30952/g.60467 Transcript_30952/m.60467 type:complete len:265 (-) Transcript_30952:123-917(-)